MGYGSIPSSRVHIREFDTLKDLLEYASDTNPTDMPKADRSSQTDSTKDPYYAQWYGSKDYKSAEDIALNWTEGADMVTSFRAIINKNTRVPKKVTIKSVVPPGVINVGAVVSGDPEAYYRRENTARLVKGAGKVVRIVVDASANCDVKAANMQRRGAAVLSLIDALEKSGRRCELTMVWANNCGGHQLEYRLLVKRASQRVSLNAMAFAVAHPAMFRRVIFSAMEHESKQLRETFNVRKWGGYGHAALTLMRDAIKKNNGIYIDNSVYAFDNDRKAQDWVVDQAEKQGIQLRRKER